MNASKKDDKVVDAKKTVKSASKVAVKPAKSSPVEKASKVAKPKKASEKSTSKSKSAPKTNPTKLPKGMVAPDLFPTLPPPEKKAKKVSLTPKKKKETVAVEVIENTVFTPTFDHLMDASEQAQTPLRIVMTTAEAHPYAKSGGLADVCASLPAALADRGHTVSVILPYYPQVMKELCAQTKVKLAELKVPFGAWEEWCAIRYISVNKNLTFYFIEFNRYYDRPKLYDFNNVEYGDNAARYIFFCRAAMEAMIYLKLRPDIINAHDWHAALCNVYLRSDLYRNHPTFRGTRSVMTIHNLGYQGNFDKENLWLSGLGWEYFNHLCLEFNDRLNFLKGGILMADMVTTVSPTYAEEILTPEHAFGLDGVLRHCACRGQLYGVLNGIDYDDWNPQVDSLIPARFSHKDLNGKWACKAALQRELGLTVDPRKPIIGVVSRLAAQKGIDVFLAAIDPILAQDRAQIVILGSGDPGLHSWVDHYCRTYPGKFGGYIGFSNKLAHLIEAGSDFFAMPSRYEPCGLNQMYSMVYGTLPIVRSTGGLADTVINFEYNNLALATGFKFHDLNTDALRQTLWWAIDTYERFPDAIAQMQQNGMTTDFSWNKTAKSYEEIYDKALRSDS